MKASVPSEPTRTWAKMSTGRSKSTKALSPYPVVFFIRYFARMRSTSWGCARISSLSSSNPRCSAGSRARSSSSAPSAPLSITVPEGRTKVSEWRVW
jgi:hypothetical protein